MYISSEEADGFNSFFVTCCVNKFFSELDLMNNWLTFDGGGSPLSELFSSVDWNFSFGNFFLMDCDLNLAFSGDFFVDPGFLTNGYKKKCKKKKEN